MKKGMRIFFWTIVVICALSAGIFLWIRSCYRRPYREVVERSGLSPALVYAVMKAESGFHEDAVSRAGAVGLMQVLPSTAEFICRGNGVEFDAERLREGEYNTQIGCLYLSYLMGRFEEQTAIAAYNAGEGTVTEWLRDGRFSEDGKSLKEIPYPETAAYVKKVMKFRKKYLFFYREST